MQTKAEIKALKKLHKQGAEIETRAIPPWRPLRNASFTSPNREYRLKPEPHAIRKLGG